MYKGGNDCKYSTHRKYIVEVGYYIVCVMKDDVERGIS